ISYDGTALNTLEKRILKSALRSSNHPLSRTLYNTFSKLDSVPISKYDEVVGKGIIATYNNEILKLGSSNFVLNSSDFSNLDTAIYISFNGVYKGKFTFKNSYRKGVKGLFKSLKDKFSLSVVSGDNEGEKLYLEQNLPKETTLLFNQKPEDKLNVIAQLQKENKKVAMIGDGLNDAGALAQSDVGIALSENINVFSPACDGILDASKFSKIATFINVSKKAIKIIKYSFLLSLCYNLIGLGFAITGNLMPVIAAILMPLSSISIVIFTTISTNILGKKIK
ncbi:HAD-IC family P-type ATPase, partial [Polaribacter sp.]|uniref:HAD-IC family P-type ATPase n=1 Tax=Polaribacter sp. TaxID=1920175 RepID=UPI0035C8392C